jgi:glutaryl-CoA dehydrogenase
MLKCRENILPNISGRRPFKVPNSARYGIARGVIGAAMDCYDTALRYALEKAPGNPSLFQLQQKKLAEMVTEITR